MLQPIDTLAEDRLRAKLQSSTSRSTGAEHYGERHEAARSEERG